MIWNVYKLTIMTNTMPVSLRDQYWLVGGRYVCKRVTKFCVSCQRQDVHCSDQAMAPLPRLRVTPSPPFAVSGLDHAGPLFCCDLPGKKFYVLLFTCPVTRALHLELVSSLSYEDTLITVRRFASLRGMPSVLMSDNEKGFKAAYVQKLKVLGPDGPEWKFIAPRSPWWGGWWERLIRCVKSSLRKSVGNKSLTRVELETVLVEIEGILSERLGSHWRPLTFLLADLLFANLQVLQRFLIPVPMTSHCVWVTAMTLWRSFGICGLKSISVLCHPTEVLCLRTVWRLGQWSSSRMRGPHGCSGLWGSFRNCTQVVMVMSAPFRWRLLRVCLYVPFSVFIIWKSMNVSEIL